MVKKEIQQIVDRYLNNTATESERNWIETHYVQLLGKEGGVAGKKQLELASENLRARIQAQTEIDFRRPARRRSIPDWLRYAAAVLIVFALAGGIYWMQFGRQGVSDIQTAADILPGGNRATLRIAEGQTVELSSAQSALITGNKLQYGDGSEVLDKPLGDLESISTRLTLSTPKGGTYQVVLPDGTKVWLNAASELSYPSEFAGDQRRVELNGEAYFSVTKDPARPFRVVSKGQLIEVLGTQFNVMAYPEETQIRSTLIEGSVRISGRDNGNKATEPIVLDPGQQAIWKNGVMEVHSVDLETVTAWKNGRFSFKGKPFDQLMRELGRWYNIEVDYQGRVPEVEFYGGAFRNHKLSTVLRLLESAGLEYKIQDRTLIVVDNTTSEEGGTR